MGFAPCSIVLYFLIGLKGKVKLCIKLNESEVRSLREMVWEGDRLFCFLQQSKLETCGSPDKLSRVGELAGLITGRAKTG